MDGRAGEDQLFDIIRDGEDDGSQYLNMSGGEMEDEEIYNLEAPPSASNNNADENVAQNTDEVYIASGDKLMI
jgi:hypothetical protein